MKITFREFYILDLKICFMIIFIFIGNRDIQNNM